MMNRFLHDIRFGGRKVITPCEGGEPGKPQEFDMPSGLGKVIIWDGEEIYTQDATKVRIIKKSDGATNILKTAFPVKSE